MKRGGWSWLLPPYHLFPSTLLADLHAVVATTRIARTANCVGNVNISGPAFPGTKISQEQQFWKVFLLQTCIELRAVKTHNKILLVEMYRKKSRQKNIETNFKRNNLLNLIFFNELFSFRTNHNNCSAMKISQLAYFLLTNLVEMSVARRKKSLGL